MSADLLRVCATPGCPALTHRTHCERHEHARYSRAAWQRERSAAMRAARHRCQRCGARRSLVVHHLGPSAQPTATEVLCRSCHAHEHGVDRVEARRRRASTFPTHGVG